MYIYFLAKKSIHFDILKKQRIFTVFPNFVRPDGVWPGNHEARRRMGAYSDTFTTAYNHLGCNRMRNLCVLKDTINI